MTLFTRVGHDGLPGSPHLDMPLPLVLAPGLLCDALLWQPQITGLAGRADCWVADHTRADTIAAVAAGILADAPFRTFALAGLSYGGYVAFELMRQAPERITHLALLDTSARADTDETKKRRLDLIALAERGRFMGVSDALIPQLIHPDRQADTALVATIKTMARNTGKAAFIRQERAIMGRIDSRPLLAAIRCPTLVLCGREDRLTPLALHAEIAAAVPAASLEVIERCGHLSTLEAPAEVNDRLLRWLDTP